MASFSQSYPTITRWIEEQGWIEIGADEYSTSLIRALDPGGLVWESNSKTDAIDDALIAAEEALKDWFEQNG